VGPVPESNTGWDAQLTGSGSGPEFTAAFRSAIERTCQDFCAHHDPLLAPLGGDARRLGDAARRSVSGGKRFRAAFGWWGHHAAAGTAAVDSTALLRACAALEFLHASALVHDDYIDASDVRRGRPASHRAFADEHRDSGWTGDPEQYGAAAAILLGDLLLSWADELLRTCGLPTDRVLAALREFDRTRTEVVAGQFLDVSVQARGRADVDEAMTVLRYKSAKYSVERPLNVGAALGGAAPRVQAQLSAFGLPLGEAFQLRDDLLGVFGDPAVTGKPAGDDLREGKRTVLVARALEALPAADAARLDHALGTQLKQDDVDDLRGLIDSSGARERIEKAIDGLTDQALAALARADIAETARVALGDLAAKVTRREL